jgi:hypothetical protein
MEVQAPVGDRGKANQHTIAMLRLLCGGVVNDLDLCEALLQRVPYDVRKTPRVLIFS